MSKFEKIVLLCVIGIFSIGIIWGLFSRDQMVSADPFHSSSQAVPTVQFPIELNRASASDLKAIKGIGDVKSRWIIEYRESNGPFESVEDLLEVTGIGPKTLESMREFVYVENEQPNGSSAQKTSHKVSINSADLKELMTLPGIGEVKGQRIIDYRETSGRFQTVEDLLNVSGIGEKTLETLKPLIICE